MKIVQGDEVPLVRYLEYRGGMFHQRSLLEGTPGTIDNFGLIIGTSQGDFYSPRHRHNFEQIRVQLDGTLDFDRDGAMSAGIVGYFPEGVFYGPQSQDAATSATAIVMQFGGSSGSGYLSNTETIKGMEELRKLGEFKNGVFRRREPLFGKKNADGNQAIWEHYHQRPLRFPKPRYNKPIMIDPRNYVWVPVAGSPGAYEKLLGVWTERRTQASQVKLDPGATYTGKGRGVYLVLRGEGRIGETPLRPLTTLFLDWNETAVIAASAETEIMYFGLPDLAGVTLNVPEFDEVTEVVAEAAE